MSRRLSRVSGVSGVSGSQRIIDVDLLDEPGSRYSIEALLGEGTFGEVKNSTDYILFAKIFNFRFIGLLIHKLTKRLPSKSLTT